MLNVQSKMELEQNGLSISSVDLLQGSGSKERFWQSKSQPNGMGKNTAAAIHQVGEELFETRVDDQSDKLNNSISTSDTFASEILRHPMLYEKWNFRTANQLDMNEKLEEDQRMSHASSNSCTSSEISDTMQELSFHCENANTNQEQKINKKNNTHLLKPVFTKNPRPNSLAILSRSHDFIHTLSIEGDCNEEVSNAVSHNYRDKGEAVSIGYRAVSADTLLQQPSSTSATVGLQRRRNQRPTSLQIPSLLHVPLSTAPYVNSGTQCLSSRAPPTRQRSYSMPGNTLTEMSSAVSTESICSQSHSLDEALYLLNKKKLNRKDIDEQSLLHRAVDAGHVKLVKKCIQSGCTVMKRLDSLVGSSALHCAARADQNSAQITKLLLETGIDPNTTNDLGETAIFSAIIHKNMETVTILIDHGCDINSVWQNSTPIYLMLYNKNPHVVTRAIESGAAITQVPENVRQPLHAVLDLCHTQAITYQIMQLLKIMVEADGNAVEHLHEYRPNMPGRSEQDIIYHIYRMEKGPVQNEGKDLVRSLVKLGYTPTRGELSTMSHSNDDYDYLYSYIKHGPSPLKDLCVRTLRKTFCSNVVYAVNKLPPIPEKEKLQILLKKPEPPENDYENYPVVKRQKETPKSRPKSLKNLVTGFARLTRKFSKKSTHGDSGTSGLQFSLPVSKGSLKVKARTLPTEKPPIKPKPKYVKRETLKSSSSAVVADLVRRYSKDDISEAGYASGNTGSSDNLAYESENDDIICNPHSSEEKLPVDQYNNLADAEPIAKFYDEPSMTDYKTIGDKGQLTPMSELQSTVPSLTVFRASIQLDYDNDHL